MTPVSDPVQPPARRQAGPRALLLLLALTLLPPLLAAALYWSGWHPARTANHGELVQPPLPVPAAALGAATEGRWRLVVAADAPCAESCVALATTARAVQVALARDMTRVRRVVASRGESSALAALRAQQPDLVAVPFAAGWQDAAGGAGPQLLLVDPAGNLVLRYAAEADPSGIRADLERLLKYSWIG